MNTQLDNKYTSHIYNVTLTNLILHELLDVFRWQAVHKLISFR